MISQNVIYLQLVQSRCHKPAVLWVQYVKQDVAVRRNFIELIVSSLMMDVMVLKHSKIRQWCCCIKASSRDLLPHAQLTFSKPTLKQCQLTHIHSEVSINYRDCGKKKQTRLTAFKSRSVATRNVKCQCASKVMCHHFCCFWCHFAIISCRYTTIKHSLNGKLMKKLRVTYDNYNWLMWNNDNDHCNKKTHWIDKNVI